jgi:hypothetical protein
MERQARIVAEFGEYERAESLMEESSSARAAAIQSRQDEINDVYNRLMRQLEAKHSEEIRLNQEKKAQRIGEVTLRYEKEIDRLRKQLTNAAHKYQITRDLNEEEGFFQEITPPELEPPEPLAWTPSRPPSGLARPGKTEKSPTARRTPTSPRSPRSPRLRIRGSPMRRTAPPS